MWTVEVIDMSRRFHSAQTQYERFGHATSAVWAPYARAVTAPSTPWTYRERAVSAQCISLLELSGNAMLLHGDSVETP